MSTDLARAHAWLEHHDEIVRAGSLVARFIEHPHASVEDLWQATTSLREASSVLEKELEVRMSRRGERCAAALGITWV